MLFNDALFAQWLTRSGALLVTAIWAAVLLTCNPARRPPALAGVAQAPWQRPQWVARGSFFHLRHGKGYQSTWLRGVNLGMGVPGYGPTGRAITSHQYRRWLDEMSSIGFNVVRVLAPHPPRFYRALAQHNRRHTDAQLHLLQGIYLEEQRQRGSRDLFERSVRFDRRARAVVDAVHGRSIHGNAYPDVSRWVVGYLIGREIASTEVLATDSSHSRQRAYAGRHLRVSDTNPSTVWAVGRLDALVSYERRVYGDGHPVGFLNWSELDPMTHPTEPRESGKDSASIDLSAVEVVDHPAGHFLAYDAYPYYPDFINDEPRYRARRDDDGPNSYLGYLEELAGQRGRWPILLAEFGVPTSWVRVKSSFSKMHHGGHSEAAQGRAVVRMFRNARQAGFAGAVQFQWADGWFKPVWISRHQVDVQRLRFWHDVMNPEQGYGLLAFDPASPDFEQCPRSTGHGAIRSVRAAANAEYFLVNLDLAVQACEDDLAVGFSLDPNGPGNVRLPGALVSPRPVQFILTIPPRGPGVWRRYCERRSEKGNTDTVGQRGSKTEARCSDGNWAEVTWRIAHGHLSKDGRRRFGGEQLDVGRLQVCRACSTFGDQDAVAIQGKRVQLRIPWLLLSVADPSQLRWFNHLSTGTANAFEAFDGVAVIAAYQGAVVSTERCRWSTWDAAPATTERLKSGVGILKSYLRTTFAGASASVPGGLELGQAP